ncbi:putative disease resistance protein RGA3, partial [Bienertia sinuspersici]
LGKTTLARRLYYHKQVDTRFGKKAWICVSEDFEIVNILKKMLELVTLHNHGLSDIEAITNKLQEKLKGESFLLILDDVWEKNQWSWDSLINRLQRIGDPSKSLILITTRSAEVKADSQLKEVSDARHFVINFEKGKLIPEMPTELDVRKLRTLNFLSGLPRWDSIICARYVRVLIMADIRLRDIPIGIGQLIHLRYLDLSGNDIIKLPESICQLYQLQTLRIKGNSRLKELPREWYKLENLIHIKTETLLSVSRGLGLLTNLQTLPSLELHDEVKGWKIDELENLNQIKGKVHISGLENVKNNEEARKASFGRKDGILQLRLEWNLERKGSSENMMMVYNDEDVLGSLEPPPYIKSLVVKGFMGVGFPRWIKTMVVNHTILLSSLIKVELIYCERCEQLPTLGQLPNLKILILKGFEKVKSIGNEFYYESSSSNNTSNYNVGIIAREEQGLFGALKELYFSNFKNLTTWMPCSETNVFTSLVLLKIENCPNLKRVPTLHSQYLKSLELDNVGGTQTLDIIKYNHTNLEKLVILDCEYIKSFPNGEMEMMMTSLKKLVICGCPALGGIPTSIGNYTSLESLEIRDCENLKSFPDGEMEMRMTSLKQLHISECPALGGIPTSIGNCTSLESLEIWDCPSIEGPVPDLSKLQRLEKLYLRNAGELLRSAACLVSQVHHLRELTIGGFRDEEQIISFVSHIKSSYSLPLSLREHQHLLPSSTLQELIIAHFDELEALPEWTGNLSSLQTLILNNCKELKYLPSKQAMLRLSQLRHLFIFQCPLLKERCNERNKNSPDSQWPNIERIPDIVIE